MSIKKRVSKSIALALVGVSVTTPVLNNVNAMENNIDVKNENIQILHDSEETETINEYLKLKELNKIYIKCKEAISDGEKEFEGLPDDNN